MKYLNLIAFIALLTLPSTALLAQPKKITDAMPEVPQALIPLEEKGAQLRYLGTENGMDGWIAIYQGQEQFYYITPDKRAFVTGLMFAQDGRPITIEQVKDLQAQGGAVLDSLAQDRPPEKLESVQSVTESMSAQTPAQKMFAEVERSNWIALGKPTANAPVLYSFIDPQCPHCHEFIQGIRKDYIDSGKLEVRIIPVGFFKGSLEQSAFLLGAPDASERFFKHLDGDKEALPIKESMSTQAVQKNMALMQAWKFNVTPLTIYKSAKGEIKIVRGKPKNIEQIITDLGHGS